MITYLIEFAILHLVFFGIYKVMLAKETHLSFLRSFLIGSTILSLILPIVEIPTKASIPTIDTEAILLPVITASQQSSGWSLTWYEIVIVIISTILALKLLLNLIQIYGWYRQSETDKLDEIIIRKVAGLQNSFTFFQWIFIDPRNFEHPEDIIRHELGHAKKLHSMDLLFFHLLTITFWWLPSMWLMIRELKAVHEFEADEYALRINNSTYTKTLVQCTLKAHGMDLASSFDDAPIFNRLNFMKKMKKKISIWKVASIAALVAISGAMFACEEQMENDQINSLNYSADTQLFLETISSEYPNDVFEVVVAKLPNGSKIDDISTYKEKYTVYALVREYADSDFRNVEMIQSNRLSTKYDLTKVQQKVEEQIDADEDKVIVETIVEKSALFPGGLESFHKFINENMIYPSQASRLGVEGKVFVEFIIEKDGSLSNFKVLKGIGAGCDNEAKRILAKSPKWVPATKNGKIVRQKMAAPIAFTLPD